MKSLFFVAVILHSLPGNCKKIFFLTYWLFDQYEYNKNCKEDKGTERKGPRSSIQISNGFESPPDAHQKVAARRWKGFLIMFGLVPFVSNNDLQKEENVFDRLMNVFDEPFMQSFHTPEFKVDVKDNKDSYDLTAELPGLKK